MLRPYERPSDTSRRNFLARRMQPGSVLLDGSVVTQLGNRIQIRFLRDDVGSVTGMRIIGRHSHRVFPGALLNRTIRNTRV